MINYYLVILSFIFSQSGLNAQSLKIFGKAEPGNILIGKAENVKEVFLDDLKLQIDNKGVFILGFDRDATGTHILKINYNDGKQETKQFKLPKRKYVVQKLKIAEKYVSPPEEELERIELESLKMKEARAEVGKIEDAFFSAGFIIPTKGRISGMFGSQRVLNGVPKSPHNGIDIAANEGNDVYAASDGEVRIAGDNFYYNGNFVLLDHGQGLTSVYLHLSKLNVKTGDVVKKGEKLGEVGSTGRSTSAHLHWGVQWYGKRIDPMSLLNLNF